MKLTGTIALVAALACHAPQASADIDGDLMREVAMGRTAQAKALLAKGANPNVRHGTYGITPLMLAAFRGRKGLVDMLLAAGADVNLPDKDGAPALNHAALGGALDGSLPNQNSDVIALLRAKGATAVSLEGVKQYIWVGGRPWPPKCYEDYGEQAPCGKEPPKVDRPSPVAAAKSPATPPMESKTAESRPLEPGKTGGISAVGSNASPATAAPDFSGLWRLNVSRSSFISGASAPDSAHERIEHRPGLIKFTTSQSFRGKTQSMEAQYSLDGSDSKNLLGSIQVVSQARWDGGTLVVQSRLRSEGGAFDKVDRWTMSTDGQTLICDRHITSGKGASMRLVFERDALDAAARAAPAGLSIDSGVRPPDKRDIDVPTGSASSPDVSASASTPPGLPPPPSTVVAGAGEATKQPTSRSEGQSQGVGTALGGPMRRGDALEFVIRDNFTGNTRRARWIVDHTEPGRISFNNGNRIEDEAGAVVQHSASPTADFDALEPPTGWLPRDKSVGSRWQVSYKANDGEPPSTFKLDAHAVMHVPVTTALGTFNAVLVEYNGWAQRSFLTINHQVQIKAWVELGSHRLLAHESHIVTSFSSPSVTRVSRERMELVSIRRAP